MLPPIHGDTTILDLPERWLGKSLEEIVNYRLNLVRGIQQVKISNLHEKYVENLQEVAMATKPIDSDIDFVRMSNHTTIDGENPPFGPIGEIKKANFSNSSSDKNIQRVFYDKDLMAQESVLQLYNNGIEISRIQKCLSIGMFGKNRKLVPTRWSIAATDDIISKSLVSEITDFDIIDSCRVFTFQHLGNFFSVVLFPSRWMFEMQEAWYDLQGNVGFGSDFEDARGLDHYPNTAGAHFASRLGVAEYLFKNKVQAGVMVLREIRPEYTMPLGVWQIREGIRMAMKQIPIIVPSFEEGFVLACKTLSIDKKEWLANSNLQRARRQKSISDFF
jgi:hypothetical protein